MKKKNIPSVTTVFLLTVVFAIFVCGIGLSFGQQLTGPYLGQTPPGNTPQMFVPNQLRSNADWWWHGALAFTPDGEEFYLDIYVPANNTGIQIRFMEMINNVWTSPQPPSFTGSAMDASPSFTDNGNKVFFISTRPNGSSYGVWTSTRTQNGWSTPAQVNIPYTSSLQRGWRVSATTDETLYLRMKDNTINTDMDIYQVRNINGVYSAPERLDDNINSSFMDLSAFINPEENYIILASDRPGGYGGTDLYISSKETDGSWRAAINMGEPVNTNASESSPFVSADGLYLFFNSDRIQQYDSNPYWVDAQVIYDLVTDVKDAENPGKFELKQNYPNPFNPITKISYYLPHSERIEVSIYNIFGQKIRILYSGYQTLGIHTLQFDGSNLSSGIYYYQLKSKRFSEIMKCILIK